jgi:glycosyltransferase involved in cell wall biosynthesis
VAEFVGPGGLLVDPLDADAMAAALEIVLGERHDEFATAGLKQSTRYSWDDAAALTVEAYRAAMS